MPTPQTDPGMYWGTITEAVTSQAKTGTPQLVLTFEITHRQARTDEGSEELPSPIERRVYLFLSDGAWPISQEKLQALGFNGDFDNPNFSAPQQWIQCKHETYNGSLHEKWEIPGGGGEVEKADAGTITKLSARWKNANKPVPVPPGSPSSPPRSATAPFDGSAPAPGS